MIFYRTQERRLIENYELAKADNFEGWDLHHRLELTLDGEYALSASDLIRMNMYYDRPYFELIYLRHREHAKLHGHARPVTDNMRKFFREYKFSVTSSNVNVMFRLLGSLLNDGTNPNFMLTFENFPTGDCNSV